ncbi:MAG: hypothetical protein NUK65_05670 [Firmicutes bacterium]|nr:hypothetical protein [Bacillota bacterium]
MEQVRITYKCLDPRGDLPDREFISPAKRLSDLNNKTIYFLDIIKRNSKVIMRNLMDLMKEQFPDSNLVYYPKTSFYSSPEAEEWWDEIAKNADAAVIAVGD